MIIDSGAARVRPSDPEKKTRQVQGEISNIGQSRAWLRGVRGESEPAVPTIFPEACLLLGREARSWGKLLELSTTA